MSVVQIILDWIVMKAKEPSTWVGLGTMSTAVGWQVSPEHWNVIATIGMGLGGLMATILSEKKSQP
jgi:hypothetical protein